MNYFIVLLLVVLLVVFGLLLVSGYVGVQVVLFFFVLLSQVEFLCLVQEQVLQIQQLEVCLCVVEGGYSIVGVVVVMQFFVLDICVVVLEFSQVKVFKVIWFKGVLEFSSVDGVVVFCLCGCLFVDVFSIDGFLVSDCNIFGIEICLVWLGVEGCYGIFGWVVEGDFVDNVVVWKLVYVIVDYCLFGLLVDLIVGNCFNDWGIDGFSSIFNMFFQD